MKNKHGLLHCGSDVKMLIRRFTSTGLCKNHDSKERLLEWSNRLLL